MTYSLDTQLNFQMSLPFILSYRYHRKIKKKKLIGKLIKIISITFMIKLLGALDRGLNKPLCINILFYNLNITNISAFIIEALKKENKMLRFW